MGAVAAYQSDVSSSPLAVCVVLGVVLFVMAVVALVRGSRRDAKLILASTALAVIGSAVWHYVDLRASLNSILTDPGLALVGTTLGSGWRAEATSNMNHAALVLWAYGVVVLLPGAFVALAAGMRGGKRSATDQTDD